jgi:hypothetical protein
MTTTAAAYTSNLAFGVMIHSLRRRSKPYTLPNPSIPPVHPRMTDMHVRQIPEFLSHPLCATRGEDMASYRLDYQSGACISPPVSGHTSDT